MHVREYTEGDLDALRAIHAAQGFDYAFPDLRNPLFVTKLVLAQNATPEVVGAQHAAPPQVPPGCVSDGEDGRKLETDENPGSQRRIIGAALLRLTAEAYLLLDPKAGSPRERWQWLLALHVATERDAWQRGLDDVHAWLPPPIAKKFGRRLEHLGWLRDDSWKPYCKRLG